MTTNARLRFAPSPTGQIHIGNIRTALFNYLYARHIGAEFVVRVENTDASRSEQEYEHVIFREMKWLGIDWDEGPYKGGDYGPYRQSERNELYDKYAEKLLEDGKAYYCYCSEDELDAMREKQRARGEMPRYDGRCYQLSEEDRQQFEQEGKSPVIRFRVPANQTIRINDMVRGEVDFESDGIGDFVMIKSDGMPSYNYACVIDDYLMDITHVLRGEDHLSNTPRQVMIYRALGFETPEFGHMSLILGPDKAKLSKRHGDTFIAEYRSRGFLPEAMVNFLALLGWSPPGEEELFTQDQLIDKFDISRVSKSAAVFDVDKLEWMNSHYIKDSAADRIFDLSKEYLLDSEILTEEDINDNREYLVKAVELTKEKLEVLSELPEHLKIFIGDEVSLTNQELEVLSDDQVKELLPSLRDSLLEADEFDPKSVKKLINKVGKSYGVKGKQLFMPVRVAISGKTQGPEIDEMISLLGAERAASRINSTLEHLS